MTIRRLPSAGRRSVSIFAALLAVAAIAAPTGAESQVLKRVGDQVFLGRSLTGEECRLKLLERRDKRDFSHLGIFCEGRAAAAGTVIGRRPGAASLTELATRGDWQQSFEVDLACARVQTVKILHGVPAALRRCTMRQGGWQQLVLATNFAEQTFLMTGLPTVYPLLEEAVLLLAPAGAGKNSGRGRVTRRIARLEAQVGASFRLIGVQQIGAYEKLRRLGHHHNSAKAYGRAADAWRRALEIQERLLGPEQPSVGNTIAHLALNVSNEGRFDEAEALFRRAEALVRRSKDLDHYPSFLVYRAFHYESQGRYRKALELVRTSVRLRQNGKTGKDALAHSLFEASRLHVKLREHGRARDTAGQALVLYRDAYGSSHWWVAETYDLLAEIHNLLGEHREARSYNGKAMALRRVLFGPSAPLAQSYVQLGDILSAEGRRAEALTAYRQMASIVFADRRALDGSERNPLMAYILTALKEAEAESDPARKEALRAEAFVASQLPRGGAAARAIDLMAARLASGSDEIAAKSKSLQDARARLSAMRQNLAREMSRSSKDREPEREARLKSEIKNEAEAVQAAEEALATKHPRYHRLIAPRPLDPAAIRGLLRPDEAMVSFFIGEDATVAFLVGDGKTRAKAVTLSRNDLFTVVSELRAGVAWVEGSGATFDTRLSRKLYEILLGGFSTALANVRHLIFVPTGPLLSLPPGLLVTEPIEGDPTDYAAIAWLVRRYAVSVLPSVHSIKAMRTQTTRSRASRPFIGFGAPNFAGRTGDKAARRSVAWRCNAFASGANRSVVRSLPGLPETSAELHAIAASLGASSEAVLLGDAASETTVRQAGLRDYRVIAFATHGLLPEALACKVEPALALTPGDGGGAASDGLLAASEIANLDLDAELALLSACDTAGPDGSLGGESLSGLATAFIYAGARRVVASHWAVWSMPTVRLTTGLFDRIARHPKDGYAEALRQSQLALLNQPNMAHPAIWAPFVLIGDGGIFSEH